MTPLISIAQRRKRCGCLWVLSSHLPTYQVTQLPIPSRGPQLHPHSSPLIPGDDRFIPGDHRFIPGDQPSHPPGSNAHAGRSRSAEGRKLKISMRLVAASPQVQCQAAAIRVFIAAHNNARGRLRQCTSTRARTPSPDAVTMTRATSILVCLKPQPSASLVLWAKGKFVVTNLLTIGSPLPRSTETRKSPRWSPRSRARVLIGCEIMSPRVPYSNLLRLVNCNPEAGLNTCNNARFKTAMYVGNCFLILRGSYFPRAALRLTECKSLHQS
jgi:hypothetical protein